jgi:peptidoglycan/LPS O-acetylase OafA/YrhL
MVNHMKAQMSARHIPALDGIRGLAALGIFIFHYGGSHSSNSLIRLAGVVINFGWAAVSLFFVLSGFLIMRWLRWLGKISYGIYVYHILLNPLFVWIVARTFPGLGHDAHFLAIAIVAAVGTLTVATLSFYGFEAPILRLKPSSEKVVRRTKSTAIATESGN